MTIQELDLHLIAFSVLSHPVKTIKTDLVENVDWEALIGIFPATTRQECRFRRYHAPIKRFFLVSSIPAKVKNRATIKEELHQSSTGCTDSIYSVVNFVSPYMPNVGRQSVVVEEALPWHDIPFSAS